MEWTYQNDYIMHSFPNLLTYEMLLPSTSRRSVLILSYHICLSHPSGRLASHLRHSRHWRCKLWCCGLPHCSAASIMHPQNGSCMFLRPVGRPDGSRLQRVMPETLQGHYFIWQLFTATSSPCLHPVNPAHSFDSPHTLGGVANGSDKR